MQLCGDAHLSNFGAFASPERRLVFDVNAPIEAMIPQGMTFYARLCGWPLARAHTRSGDRIALAAYLGGSAKFDQAIAGFAETYADQNELDYAALQAAVKDGTAEASSEI